MRSYQFCVIFTVSVMCNTELPSKLVNTAQGPVRGYKDPHYGVYAFYNIPYATAPVGIDRFKAPLPPPNWKEPFEAVDEGIICPQVNFFDILPKTLKPNQNCLIANVYVPDTDVKSLPVAVFVHGGAFVMGYGNMVDPRDIVSTKQLIVVTFNYRVGGHGFLCLGTEAVPGNAGLKDMVALLHWVQKNIANFGGDPDNVTLVGVSAGANAVDLLMLSRVTDGLFHKVIPESGASTAYFAVQIDPLESAEEYAKLLNDDIETNSVHALEELFTQTSLEHLNSVIFSHKNNNATLVGPCIERYYGEEQIITDNPVDTLGRGDHQKLPMLHGFTNMEGLMRTFFNRGEIERDLVDMNRNFSNYLPRNLQFKNDHERDEVANEIKMFYFGTSIDKEDILEYVYYFTDIYVAYPTLLSIKLQVEAGNDQIYLYEYSFADDNDPSSTVPFTKIRGANHCAQSASLWGTRLQGFDYFSKSKDYKKMQKKLRNLWLNFISTGNPTPEGSSLPEWPAAGGEWSPHMSLGGVVMLRDSLLKDRALFWERIYARHYRAPQPPPTHRRTEL